MSDRPKMCWCDIPIELHSEWMVFWHLVAFEWQLPRIVAWLNRKLTRSVD